MQFCSDWACEKMPLLMFFHSQGLYSPCRVIFTSNTGRCYQEIQQNSIFVNLLHTEEHVTSHNYLVNVFFCKERNTFENFFVNYSCVLFECEAIFCFVLQPQTFWHKPFHIALIFPLTHTHTCRRAMQTRMQELAYMCLFYRLTFAHVSGNI